MGILVKSLRTGVVTVRTDNNATPSMRGFPVIDAHRCQGCGDCAGACPTGALAVTSQEAAADDQSCSSGCLAVVPASGGWWRLDVHLCLGCGDCARACARGALCCGGDFAHRETWTRAPGAAVRPARSLHIRHLDGGSCNACDWEMVALTNPVYDIQRLGMDFVASPRHADVLMVTGPVARNLELAVVKTYQATPAPKLVVAVGTCACSGGLFNAGYASRGGVNRVLPVDVYIPGCPPSPAAMIQGLRQAAVQKGND